MATRDYSIIPVLQYTTVHFKILAPPNIATHPNMILQRTKHLPQKIHNLTQTSSYPLTNPQNSILTQHSRNSSATIALANSSLMVYTHFNSLVGMQFALFVSLMGMLQLN
ncbi:hypothetical protein FGO68_gene4257 [Halteria grandinella]|uniref:Uncharacterized protein n=1 Tax=Halteria grandinella TaxID=5974 RepID=A0A8J8TAQ4_HALGN|nr:hypothetical protein FGO68_gene4257 [Halteria grandinella]